MDEGEWSNFSARSGSQLQLALTTELRRKPALNSTKATSSGRGGSTVSTSKHCSAKRRLIACFDQILFEAYLRHDLADRLVSHNSSNAADGVEQILYCSISSEVYRPLVMWTACDATAPLPAIPCWSDIRNTEPFALGVMDATTFLDALIAAPDTVEFPQLLLAVNTMFQGASHCAYKVLSLVELDKHCVNYQRKLMKTGRTGASVVDLVDCAVSYLLYELDVEVATFKKRAELSEYVATLTRLVAARVPEEHLVVTEIDCVAKAARERTPEGLSSKEAETFEHRQTWGAMLQMLPGMSKDRAQALLQDADCTCPRKMRRLFHSSGSAGSGASMDPPAAMDPAKRMLLLQGKFGKTKTGKAANQAKLSKHLFHMLTCADPSALISDTC